MMRMSKSTYDIRIKKVNKGETAGRFLPAVFAAGHGIIVTML